MADPDDFLAGIPIANDQTALPAAPAPLELTPAEKQKILDCWNGGSTKLKDIIETACGPGVDLRSKKGKLVQQFIASRTLSKVAPSTGSDNVARIDLMELSESQKESIRVLACSARPLEIARVIYSEPNLSNLSSEYKLVKSFYDILPPDLKLDKDVKLEEYAPPRTERQTYNCINKFCGEPIEIDRVTAKQEEQGKKLRKFLQTHRFLFEINNYSKAVERILFESSFVRFTWDKPDLTEEEIDLYINYCADMVSSYRMQKELDELITLRDELMRGDGDGGAQKFPQALLEAIGTLRGDINANAKRRETLLKDLNGKRSDRLNQLNDTNASILNLVEAFRDAAKRKLFLEVLEARKEAVKKEGTRLESVDSLHFELFGGSQDELL